MSDLSTIDITPIKHGKGLTTKQIRDAHDLYVSKRLTLKGVGSFYGKSMQCMSYYFKQLNLEVKRKPTSPIRICRREECDQVVGNHNSKYCCYECSHQDRVVNGPTVKKLVNEVSQLKAKIKELKSIIKETPSDTCHKCGCNEFLCGHNKR